MTADYRLGPSGAVIRASDGAIIPDDPDNRDRAAYEAWLEAGGAPDPYVAPGAPPSFLARDLVDQLNADDLTAIETTVQADANLRLLWLRLCTRGAKPVIATGDAFTQGWAGLMAALGAERASELAAALRIPV